MLGVQTRGEGINEGRARLVMHPQRRLAVVQGADLRAMIACVEKEMVSVQLEIYKNNENESLSSVHADLSTGLWLLEAFRVAEALEIETVWRVIGRGPL